MQPEVTNKIFTIPNLLTLIRLLLLPVFFVLLVHYQDNVLAFVVLVSAAVTDFVDGAIARATKTVSKLGQRFDPLVDRIFIIVGVIAIFAAQRVPFWVLFILIARDAVMLWVTIHQKRKYGREFQVVFLGKLTTALLMAGFCSLVLMWPMLPGANLFELGFMPGWGAERSPLGTWLVYIGVVTSLITAVYYLFRGIRPDPLPKDKHRKTISGVGVVEDVRGTSVEQYATVASAHTATAEPSKLDATTAESASHDRAASTSAQSAASHERVASVGAADIQDAAGIAASHDRAASTSAQSAASHDLAEAAGGQEGSVRKP